MERQNLHFSLLGDAPPTTQRSKLVAGMLCLGGALGFIAGRFTASSPAAAAPLVVAAAQQQRLQDPPPGAPCANAPWTQCGGNGFSGPTCCPDETSCVSRGPDFSQCVPDCLNLPWAPCGGAHFKGLTCCPGGSSCVERSKEFSQCVPAGEAAAVALVGAADGGCPTEMWTQCGGEGFKGDTCCPAGASCIVRSSKFSQCVPQ